jgi:nitrogenase-stabilizing/protective protein
MSCGSGNCGCLKSDVLASLKKLSSAEEFFEALGVTFDPKVLNVARLHILKRMGQYLSGDDLEGLPDSVAAARAKAFLERAYSDFQTSSPIEERVFKVHKDAVKPPAAPAFVPFDTLLD